MNCALCTYLYNLVRWIDQGANALIGGDPRQTLSGRFGRAELAGLAWASAVCRFIGWLWRDPEHCRGSVRAGDGDMEVIDLDGPNDTFPDLAVTIERAQLRAAQDLQAAAAPQTVSAPSAPAPAADDSGQIALAAVVITSANFEFGSKE